LIQELSLALQIHTRRDDLDRYHPTSDLLDPKKNLPLDLWNWKKSVRGWEYSPRLRAEPIPTVGAARWDLRTLGCHLRGSELASEPHSEQTSKHIARSLSCHHPAELPPKYLQQIKGLRIPNQPNLTICSFTCSYCIQIKITPNHPKH
jgi:hypothetical protein